MERVRDILNNENPKIALNSVNISQIIRAGSQNRQAFMCLIDDINLFDFEDRKKVQEIVLELLALQDGRNDLVLLIKEKGQNSL